MIAFGISSSFFNINSIQVIGQDKIPKQSIINASSIPKGENIFKINKKVGINNIEKLPYIKDVKIKRDLPRGIIINIIERKAIFQIKEISAILLLDKDGYILDKLDSKIENLPMIVGLSLANNMAGQCIFSDIDENMELKFIQEGHAIGILEKMEDINMENKDEINILLNKGIYVAFGTLDNVEYKLSLLNEVLLDIIKKETDCKMILMNKGDNPIIVLNDD